MEQNHSLSTTDNWAHVNRELVHQDWDVLYKKLAGYVDETAVDNEAVQTLMKEHFEIACRFYIPSKEAYIGMGTTIVATEVTDSQIYVGHVGDSRLYLCRNREVKRLTKDHSVVQDLIDRGFYTEREARGANVGHVVTRAMGRKVDVEVDTAEVPLLPYDLLLLCSDGLTDMVSDWQIAETINENISDLDMAAKKLIALANQNGGKDNISVILMQT